MLSGVLADGGGPARVDGRIRELEETLRRTSICGLGQVALGPVVSVLGLPGQAGPSHRAGRGEQQRSP
jgi:formate dehydrogenase beta subunit